MYPDYVQVELPSLYSQADAAWIQQQLLGLPPSLRRKVSLKYAEVYEITFDAEPVSYRRENRARHEANVRLRRFVETHGRAIQGYTTQPPLAGTQQRA
ncbi:TPA: hypothetical protein I8190_000333 [Citrobacter freundii]|uniref:hypothetical protein n=1 Tax=Citrobacter farmeri TaxID=67824 RepID=UPI001A1E8DC4|nr:hypothetical protein [Citrobacter farmeri]HAT2283653.1 hypothetical protein [Citrobacter freundii]MDB2182818.1 hypothetical protein [Citrobacter farmeri]HAT2347646.1 hypothetical protein [Citrobacter freundii]HAT2429236.1 hypothetical protein [Citrobacter freundii]HAT2498337.1 hypothetical protein [Citrobacter freundii]